MSLIEKILGVVFGVLLVGFGIHLSGLLGSLTARLATVISWFDLFGSILAYTTLGVMVVAPIAAIGGCLNWAYWYNRQRLAEVATIETANRRNLVIEQVVTPQKGMAFIDLVTGTQTIQALPAIAEVPPTVAPQVIEALSIPDVRHDNWFGEIIAKLKNELDNYNQPLTVRVSGNPGSGKTILTMNLLAELIKPFHEADIVVLDRKANKDPKKWGTLDVLADTITKYPNAMQQLNAELDKRSKGDNPLFAVVDEIDEAHKRYGDEFDNDLNNLLSVGRELGVNVFATGQSPLSKTSGIDSVTKTFFTLWAIAGIDGIEQFLNSADCKFTKSDKQLYKNQLATVAHNRFIGLAIPSRVISKPFLYVAPKLTIPTLSQTVNRSILGLPVVGSVNPLVGKSDNQLARDLAILEANSDKIVRRPNGKVITSSVCNVLGFAHGGAKWDYAKQLAEQL